jgi:8-oxo-dGTP diphosphatase
MTDTPRHSVSVAAVIVDDQDRVLLIQRRDTGAWQIPGGILELDEDIHTGLRREVREETGLDVEPERLTGVYKNMPLGVVALVFRCQTTGGRPQASDETTAVKWVESSEVAELLTGAFAIRVSDALRSLGPPAVRAHDGKHVIQTSAWAADHTRIVSGTQHRPLRVMFRE